MHQIHFGQSPISVFGRKYPQNLSTPGLVLQTSHREIEFFAGITAACMPTTLQLLARHNVLPSFGSSYFTPKLAGLRIRTSEIVKKAQSLSLVKSSNGWSKARRNSLDQWGYVSEVKSERDEICLTTCTTGETETASR